MTSLRVDPRAILATAGELAGAASELAAKSLEQSLGSAANGMAGLQTAGACTKAATAFDAQFHQLSSSLAAMSQSLKTAADEYASTDSSLGQNLKRAGDGFSR